MTEKEAADDFQHQYQDRMQAIKLNRDETANELRKDLETADRQEENTIARRTLLEEYESLHNAIVADLSTTADPQVIFERTLRSLDRLERFRFVIDNLLDAVKKDQSLNNMLQVYRDLGLSGVTWKTQGFPEEKGAARGRGIGSQANSYKKSSRA